MSTLFERLVNDPYAKRELLVELTVWVPAGVTKPYGGTSTGEEVTTYFSEDGFITEPTDTPANQPYSGRLSGGLSIRRSMYSPEVIGGNSVPGYGELVLRNEDGALDNYRLYATDGRGCRVLMVGQLSDGTVVGYGDAGVLYDGAVAGDLVVGEDEVRVRLRDEQYRFEVPAQPNLYRGMGHCVKFDGVDDRAQSGVVPTTSTYTVEFWLRGTGRPAVTTANGVVLIWGDAWSTTDLEFYITINSFTGALQFTSHGSSGGSAGLNSGSGGLYDFRDGRWRHVAVVVDRASSNTMKLYLDGELVHTNTPAAHAANATAFLHLGSLLAASNFAACELDELRVWSTARTQAEVREHMDRQLEGTEAGLTHYWQCYDNGGATVTATTGGVNITLTGTTWAATRTGLGDLAGQPVPRVLGRARHAECQAVDPKGHVYRFHDAEGQGRTGPVGTAYDSAAPLTLTTDYTVDYATGTLTLTAPPSGRITCDLWGEGPFPSAASFDGVDDWAGSYFPFHAQQATTVEFWCRANSSAGLQHIISHAAFWSTVGIDWHFNTNNFTGVLEFVVYRSTGSALTLSTGATAASVLGKWQHYALVLDTGANACKLYVNGELVAQGTQPGFAATNGYVTAGSVYSGGGNFAKVDLTELRVWYGTRTQEQIKAAMHRRLREDEHGYTSYYQPFSDANGTVARGNPEWPGELLRPWGTRDTRLRFDGSTTWVGCGTSSSFNFTSGSFTVEGWFYADSLAANSYLVSRGLFNTDGWYVALLTSGNLQFVTNQAGASQANTSAALTAGRWYHFALVRSGSSSQFYVNGVASGSAGGSHINPTTASRQVVLGAANNLTGWFSGRMSNVRIWNAARSADDIAANWYKPWTGLHGNLIGSWRLDEGSGTVAFSTGQIANHGTIAGGTWGNAHMALTGATWTGGPCSPAQLARHAVTKGATALDDAQLDADAIHAAHLAQPQDAGVAVYDNDALLAYLDHLLNFGFWYGFDRTALFEIREFVGATAASSATFDATQLMDLLEPLAVAPPVWRVRVGYAKNHTVQSASEVAGIVTTVPESYSFATREWRYATAADQTVKDDYPQARELVLHTPLATRAAAQARADTLLALYKVQRRMYRAALKTRPYSRDLGEVVTIDRDRLGLGGGVDFVITGFDEIDSDVTAEVWT